MRQWEIINEIVNILNAGENIFGHQHVRTNRTYFDTVLEQTIFGNDSIAKMFKSLWVDFNISSLLLGILAKIRKTLREVHMLLKI